MPCRSVAAPPSEVPFVVKPLDCERHGFQIHDRERSTALLRALGLIDRGAARLPRRVEPRDFVGVRRYDTGLEPPPVWKIPAPAWKTVEERRRVDAATSGILDE